MIRFNKLHIFKVNMQKSTLQLGEIKLVGIKVRTSLIEESNLTTSKIPSHLQKYFKERLAENISDRKNPGTTFCVYTEYESDYRGKYTYFIGEEVNSFEHITKEMQILSILPQKYIKFMIQPGPMPNVIIEAWQYIWNMTQEDMGGVRQYHSDFEIYDRVSDQQNTIVDIYIGIY